jgi:hypothetical protein
VPALAAYLQLGRMDWKYKTEPQPGQSNFNNFSISFNNHKMNQFLHLFACLGQACLGHVNQRCNWPRGKVNITDKIENQMFLIYKEIQSGAVAKSYMRKGFLIYEEMRKYFPIYEEAVSHI